MMFRAPSVSASGAVPSGVRQVSASQASPTSMLKIVVVALIGVAIVGGIVALGLFMPKLGGGSAGASEPSGDGAGTACAEDSECDGMKDALGSTGGRHHRRVHQ